MRLAAGFGLLLFVLVATAATARAGPRPAGARLLLPPLPLSTSERPAGARLLLPLLPPSISERPAGAPRLLPPPLPPSTAETFYVSTTGDDSAPGTFDRPWRTVQHALDTLTPGQTALVREGTYGENLRVTLDGSADKPITISSFGSEQAILRPAGGRENNYPVEIDSASYFRLHGFVIEYATGSSSADVVLENGSHHIEISGNEIRNSSDQGLWSDRTTHDLQILGNAIHDNGPSAIHQSHGIYLEGVDQLLANNVVYNNHYGYGIHVFPSADHVLIVHNTVVGNGNPATSSGGIVLGGSEDSTVDSTKIVNNVVAFNAAMGVRSFFPSWVMQPKGNEAYSNVGFGNPQGDFSTWEGGGIDYSNGNTVADPLFRDPEALNFRLTAESPAIDLAMEAFSPETDFDGVARAKGPRPDIGAFESG
jgi:Periplasmic copper-binding protein (NosD)